MAAQPEAPAPGAAGPPPLRDPRRRGPLVGVPGKGGVGRTTACAALGHAAARLGRSVLVADMGEADQGQSALARALGQEQLGPQPRQIAPGLQACHVSARKGQELFFNAILNAPVLIKIALGARPLRKLLDAAPSFYEMGQFNHVIQLLEQRGDDGAHAHELVVLDMPATGHALGLVELPHILQGVIRGGHIRGYLELGQRYLYDAALTRALVVTLPEPLPITEALELRAGLHAAGVAVGGLLLNRVAADPFSARERQALDPRLARQDVLGALLYQRLAASQRACQRLRDQADLTIHEVPELAAAGPDLVQALACHLWGG